MTAASGGWGKQEVRHWPGAVREHQHSAAVEEAVLKLSRVTRPVAEGQLTQAMAQTCGPITRQRQNSRNHRGQRWPCGACACDFLLFYLCIFSSVPHNSESGHRGHSLSRDTQTFLVPGPSHLLMPHPAGPQGVPRPAERQCPSSVSWVFPLGFLLLGDKRCLSLLSQLLSVWRSSHSTPSSSQVTELLTL